MPSIKWEKDGKRIERTMGQVKYTKWALVLEDLVPKDSGSYTCVVCNDHGCINHTTRLMVEGKFH
jgi:fibroblast growth factor receptor 2